MSNFSTNLKALRQKLSLSQQGLATALGTSKSSINMYERGEREPGLETVKALANFFEVTTDYLLGKSKEKTEGETTMPKKSQALTDEQVEREIERLLRSDAVILAKKQAQIEYRRRQYLYKLRGLEKKGKALMKAGITREVLDAMYSDFEE